MSICVIEVDLHLGISVIWWLSAAPYLQWCIGIDGANADFAIIGEGYSVFSLPEHQIVGGVYVH